MVLIARYGEIFLKGKNRLDFERVLVGNIKKMFQVGVLRKRNRLLVNKEINLRRVFGLVSYSPAIEAALEIEEIKEKSLELIKEKSFRTFKIAAKRMDAKFELNSQQINEVVGEAVLNKFDKKVDLTNPDLTIGIEIIDGRVYIFTEVIGCFGGLPVGVEGKAVLLVEDAKSILAGLLMMKRGCDLELVGFDGEDISLLQQFSPEKLELKKIKSLKEIGGGVLAVGRYPQEIFDGVVLEPLVGLDEEEINQKIEDFNLK